MGGTGEGNWEISEFWQNLQVKLQPAEAMEKDEEPGFT